MSDNFERLTQAIFPDGYLVRTWQLTGGVSAQVTGMEIGWSNGTTKKLVVRQYGERDLQADPQIAAHEFRLLQVVQEAKIPSASPYYVDAAGELAGSPALVIDFIEGTPDAPPPNVKDMATQLATHLAAIHHIRDINQALPFLPRQEATFAARIAAPVAALDDTLREGNVRTVLKKIWPLPQTNPSVLLHGDFWPGNILWRDGRIVAIIDWEDAAVGDPLADVANARLELFVAFGQEAMAHFTETYQSLTPFDFTNLAYWELGAALRLIVGLPNWGLEKEEETRIRRGLRVFVEQALESVTGKAE